MKKCNNHKDNKGEERIRILQQGEKGCEMTNSKKNGFVRLEEGEIRVQSRKKEYKGKIIKFKIK